MTIILFFSFATSCQDSPSNNIFLFVNNTNTLKSFSCKELMQRTNWRDWRASKFNQLNSYRDQNMFGSPCIPPKGLNIMLLIWTYLVKLDSIEKARCVCNGSPQIKGAVTLRKTFSAAL